MKLPNPYEYQDAIQSIEDFPLLFNDKDLKGASVECEAGLPKPRSGNFACVFKIYRNQKEWAVRFFTKEISGQKERYEAISEVLEKAKFTFMVEFKFIDNEFLVNGIRYPIVKMEWRDGDSLDSYVRKNLKNPGNLRSVADQMIEIVKELAKIGVSHGDLQHGNIIIANDKPILVDYDGMFVPSLQGQKASEIGHHNYQSPKRTNLDFGPGLDNFSLWVIWLSLYAISYDPDLWKDFAEGEECLLLKKEDFVNCGSSRLLKKLKLIAEIKEYVEEFEKICENDVFDVPLVEKRFVDKEAIKKIEFIELLKNEIEKNTIFIQNKINDIKRPKVSLSKNEFKQSDPDPWPYSDDLTWEPEGVEGKYTKLCKSFKAKKTINFYGTYCEKTSLWAMICIIAFSFLVSAGGITGMLGMGSPLFLVVTGLFFLVAAVLLGLIYVFFKMVDELYSKKTKIIGVDKMGEFYKKAMEDDVVEKKLWKDILERNNGEAKRRRLKLNEQKKMYDDNEKRKEKMLLKINGVMDEAKIEIFKIAAQFKAIADSFIREKEVVEFKICEQVNNFLKKTMIRDVEFGKIKQGRKGNLINSGIITAYDLSDSSIAKVEGFGKILREEMMIWKSTIVSEFLESKGIISQDQRQEDVENEIEFYYKRAIKDSIKIIEETEIELQSFEGKIFDIDNKSIKYRAMVRKSEIECSFIPDGL